MDESSRPALTRGGGGGGGIHEVQGGKAWEEGGSRLEGQSAREEGREGKGKEGVIDKGKSTPPEKLRCSLERTHT